MKKTRTGMMITGTIAIALMACSMVSCSEDTKTEIKETANAVVSEIANSGTAATTAAETATETAAETTAAAQTAKPAETVQTPDAVPLTNTSSESEPAAAAQTSPAAADSNKEDEKNSPSPDRSADEKQAINNARSFAGSGNYECVSSEIVLGDNSDNTFRVGIADKDNSSAPVCYYIATKDYAMIEADWYRFGPDTDKAKVYWTYQFEPGYADFGFKVGNFSDLNGSGAKLCIKKNRAAAGVYDCTVTVPQADGSFYEWIFTGERSGSALNYSNADMNCYTFDSNGNLSESYKLSSSHCGSIIDTETTLDWTDNDGSSISFDNGEN